MFGKRKENKRANVVRKNKKHGSIAVFRLFVFCMLIYCFIMPAYAATESYTIDELYMKVEIPSDLVVFLQDISENDPNITLYGFDKLELEKLYKESHICIDGVPRCLIVYATCNKIHKFI